METAQELQEVLQKTRDQYGGITLDLIGKIIKSVLDKAEVRALIKELENDEREEETIKEF